MLFFRSQRPARMGSGGGQAFLLWRYAPKKLAVSSFFHFTIFRPTSLPARPIPLPSRPSRCPFSPSELPAPRRNPAGSFYMPDCIPYAQRHSPRRTTSLTHQAASLFRSIPTGRPRARKNSGDPLMINKKIAFFRTSH